MSLCQCIGWMCLRPLIIVGECMNVCVCVEREWVCLWMRSIQTFSLAHHPFGIACHNFLHTLFRLRDKTFEVSLSLCVASCQSKLAKLAANELQMVRINASNVFTWQPFLPASKEHQLAQTRTTFLSPNWKYACNVFRVVFSIYWASRHLSNYFLWIYLTEPCGTHLSMAEGQLYRAWLVTRIALKSLAHRSW